MTELFLIVGTPYPPTTYTPLGTTTSISFITISLLIFRLLCHFEVALHSLISFLSSSPLTDIIHPISFLKMPDYDDSLPATSPLPLITHLRMIPPAALRASSFLSFDSRP